MHVQAVGVDIWKVLADIGRALSELAKLSSRAVKRLLSGCSRTDMNLARVRVFRSDFPLDRAALLA